MSSSIITPFRARCTALLVGALAAGGVLAANASAQTGVYDPQAEYRVNVTGDGVDTGIDGVCRTSAGKCSLRAALQEAAADRATSTIYFDLTAGQKHTISIFNSLPAVSDLAGPTIIDGSRPPWNKSTKPWYTVELHGRGAATGAAGLVLASVDNAVRNLALYGFRHQVRIVGWNNRVEDNILGSDRTLQLVAPAPPEPTDTSGVLLDGSAAGNVLDSNIIGGNAGPGVAIRGTSASNTVQRNLIGVRPPTRDSSSSTPLPNRSHGVVLGANTRLNVVGGADLNLRNSIGGNDRGGVQVAGTLNRIAWNDLGFHEFGAGLTVLPNGGGNVVVASGATEPRIERNRMYGSTGGVQIGEESEDRAGGITGARVLNNWIGASGLSDPHNVQAIGVSAWQGSFTVLGYNSIAFQHIGLRIGRPETPPELIDNVFEGNRTDVVR